MNQFQLILLLLLTNAYIPKGVINYLVGLKATTCSFNFIPFKDIPGLNSAVGWMDSKIIQDELDYFGIFSGSSFVNNFSVLCIMVILALFHLLFTGFYLLLKSKKPDLWAKAFQLFNATIYIRLFMMSNQFLLLSTVSEIFEFDFRSVESKVSLGISISGFVVCIVMLFLSFGYWLKLRKGFEEDQFLTGKELFSPLKNSHKVRLFNFMQLLRRFILVVYLLFPITADPPYEIIPLAVIQFCYVCYIIALRPNKEVKDNLVECVNEIFYLALIIILVFKNQKSDWDSRTEKVYLYLIILNSVVIISILIGT